MSQRTFGSSGHSTLRCSSVQGVSAERTLSSSITCIVLQPNSWLHIVTDYNSMVLAITDVVCFIVAIFTFKAIVNKIARRRVTFDATCARRHPPAVNVISLIKLLPVLWTKGPQATIYELYTKFGSVFTLNMFGPRVTFLVGPEVLTHFLQGSDSEISHGDLLEFTVPIIGKEVCTVDKTANTRIFIDALKPSKWRSHAGPMIQEVEEYFAKWGTDGMVDLKQELQQILMFISSRCLLGKEVREKMFEDVNSIFAELEGGVNLISVLFPYFPIPAHRRRDRARAKLGEIFSEIVKSRRSSGRVEDDALQRLIDSRYRDGRSTTAAEVTGLIISLLFAGKQTSSHASTWIGAYLLNNPNYLAAAVEEQKEIIKKYEDRVDPDTLLEMKTLHNCIKEAVRMHPPVPLLLRKAHKQFTVQTKEGKEYDIPEGHTVVSSIVTNNNISSIYKDPEVYDPDRFGLEREEDKVGGKFSYSTFGGGRHGCVGEAYAYMQIKVIWSHLLRNFELELTSPFPDEDWSKFMLEPKGKVMVRYKRRLLTSS